MAHLAELKEPTRTRLLNLECPTFENHPGVTGAPLARRRVAILSTAGKMGSGLTFDDLIPLVMEYGIRMAIVLLPLSFVEADSYCCDFAMTGTSVQYEKLAGPTPRESLVTIHPIRRLYATI